MNRRALKRGLIQPPPHGTLAEQNAAYAEIEQRTADLERQMKLERAGAGLRLPKSWEREETSI